ncbi:MAG: hypothetical protein ABIH90_01475 [Candidatus Aenigmatarchaeota archaeon]
MGHIQNIEKEYYGCFCQENILMNWIQTSSGHFIVAGTLPRAFLFFEYVEKAKPIPFIRNALNEPKGNVAYISDVGVLDQSESLLQELFDVMLATANMERCDKIVWIIGETKKHDIIERSFLIKNGFLKAEPIPKWEARPGYFVYDHWIWVRSI